MAENAFKADWPSFALGFNTGKSKGGGKPAEEKDVRFYDYDGTLLYSYTVEEAQKLTELPDLPTREGLTCQGWNYDLATIKEYNGAVDVGALYITDDGKTRFYITIDQDYRKLVRLYFCATGEGAIIDWGDGSPTVTFSGNTSTYGSANHTYEAMGDYVITLEPIGESVITLGNPNSGNSDDYAPPVIGGRLLTGGSRVQNNMLRRAEIGKIGNVLPRQCFRENTNLETINIPRGVTSTGTYTFSGCKSLRAVIIPDGFTTFGEYAFNDGAVGVLSLPDGVTSYGKYAFNRFKTRRLVFPSGMTSTYQYVFNESTIEELYVSNGVTRLNQYMFNQCTNLKKVSLPGSLATIYSYCFRSTAIEEIRIPNGITSIEGYTFNGCKHLKTVILPDTVTNIGTYAFCACTSLESIDIPNGVNTIGDYAFQSCPSLKSIDFPDGATVGKCTIASCTGLVEIELPEGMTSLSQNEFSGCNRLIVAKIPSSVATVGRYAFDTCISLLYVDFTKHEFVPTLSDSSLGSASSDYQVRVPAALVDEWKAATNWSSLASKIKGV